MAVLIFNDAVFVAISPSETRQQGGPLAAVHGHPRRLPLQSDHRHLVSAVSRRGKPKKLALVAAMRKLLIILNSTIRDQRPWREQTA
jgi:transposase